MALLGFDKIHTTKYSFATVLKDGSVVTWFSPADSAIASSSMKISLSEVVEIYSTSSAFAAVLKDGGMFISI